MGSAPLPTICPKCGEIDSIQHLLQNHLKSTPPEPPEELVEFLVCLAKEACVANPHIPTPARFQETYEIELDDGGEEERETT